MDEHHERVARVGLTALGRYGFALAGGYALQLHGIIERPSDDVDLFTNEPDPEKFDEAVSKAVSAWSAAGLDVKIETKSETFARFTVSTGRESVRADMSHDPRTDPPVELRVGPTLSQDDSVANKVCAVFTRAEARDYIDVHAAATSGRYTRDQLEALGTSHDPGFDLQMFAQALRANTRFKDNEYSKYGLSSVMIAELRAFLQSWADDIESHCPEK